ncbi:MAG: hypothetical protein ACK559_03125 [bacterium]
MRMRAHIREDDVPPPGDANTGGSRSLPDLLPTPARIGVRGNEQLRRCRHEL